jgi:hypothetical protein
MAKLKKELNIELQYGIKSIEELSFSLNDSIEFNEDAIGIPIKFSIDFKEAEDEVIFLVEIGYVDQNSDIEFYSIKVKNTFTLIGLKKYRTKKPGTYDLPDQFMALLLGISISHCRALMSNHLNGTKFEILVLPILNPSELIKSAKAV